MLAFGLDLLFAYLIVRRFQSYLSIISLAIIGGIVSSFVSSTVMYLLASDMFNPGEVVIRATAGLFWHPVITIVFAIIYRYMSKAPVESGLINDTDKNAKRKRDDLDDFVDFLKQSPTDADISSRVTMLVDDGYDEEILIDIVKERAGIAEYEMLRRVL